MDEKTSTSINPAGSGESRPDLIELAAPVVTRVEIESIFLVESRSYRAPAVDTEQHEANFLFDITNVKIGRDDDTKHIYVLPSFRVVLNMGDANLDTPHPVLIEATFALTYKLDSNDDLENLQLNAFGATSGIFHAWPYWREFVQSNGSRMGLPLITVPTYRPQR